jgi:hypothetical protein
MDSLFRFPSRLSRPRDNQTPILVSVCLIISAIRYRNESYYQSKVKETYLEWTYTIG